MDSVQIILIMFLAVVHNNLLVVKANNGFSFNHISSSPNEEEADDPVTVSGRLCANNALVLDRVKSYLETEGFAQSLLDSSKKLDSGLVLNPLTLWNNLQNMPNICDTKAARLFVNYCLNFDEWQMKIVEKVKEIADSKNWINDAKWYPLTAWFLFNVYNKDVKCKNKGALRTSGEEALKIPFICDWIDVSEEDKAYYKGLKFSLSEMNEELKELLFMRNDNDCNPKNANVKFQPKLEEELLAECEEANTQEKQRETMTRLEVRLDTIDKNVKEYSEAHAERLEIIEANVKELATSFSRLEAILLKTLSTLGRRDNDKEM